MKLCKEILGVIFAIVCFQPAFVSAQSQNAKMGIITGGASGTYIKIGQDIARYAAPFGITLNIKASEGSLDNLDQLRRQPGIQLGIIQQDTLYWVLEKNVDPDLVDYAKKLRLVFPLYNEEVHILAGADIRNFSDLAGKRVAVGEPKSGSWLTSSFLFQLTKVEPSQRVELGGKAALDALRSDKIDAMIYVAGQPTNLFLLDVTENDKLQFVDVSDSRLKEFYTPAKLTRTSYPWLREDVNTVSVRAILMSFDYRGENCKNVGVISRIIKDNINCMRRKEKGHPKWIEVDLDARPPKWPLYSCVEEALKSQAAFKLSSCDAIKVGVGDSIAPQQDSATASQDCDKIEEPVRRSLCRMKHDTNE